MTARTGAFWRGAVLAESSAPRQKAPRAHGRAQRDGCGYRFTPIRARQHSNEATANPRGTYLREAIRRPGWLSLNTWRRSDTRAAAAGRCAVAPKQLSGFRRSALPAGRGASLGFHRPLPAHYPEKGHEPDSRPATSMECRDDPLIGLPVVPRRPLPQLHHASDMKARST